MFNIWLTSIYTRWLPPLLWIGCKPINYKSIYHNPYLLELYTNVAIINQLSIPLNPHFPMFFQGFPMGFLWLNPHVPMVSRLGFRLSWWGHHLVISCHPSATWQLLRFLGDMTGQAVEILKEDWIMFDMDRWQWPFRPRELPVFFGLPVGDWKRVKTRKPIGDSWGNFSQKMSWGEW